MGALLSSLSCRMIRVAVFLCPAALAKADPKADPWYYYGLGGYYGHGYYGGYYPYTYGLGHYGYWGKKKRSAEPQPAADPKADPYLLYGGYYGGYYPYYGLGHYYYGKRYADPHLLYSHYGGLGYYGGYYPYGGYYWGKKKRSADPQPAADPKADPYLLYSHYGGLGYYGGYYPYYTGYYWG